jgi:hypothetical protein
MAWCECGGITPRHLKLLWYGRTKVALNVEGVQEMLPQYTELVGGRRAESAQRRDTVSEHLRRHPPPNVSIKRTQR